MKPDSVRNVQPNRTVGYAPMGLWFQHFDEDEKAVTQYMSLADGGISPLQNAKTRKIHSL